MKINICDIPEGKTFDDYPEDTVFVWKHDNRRARYDKKNNRLVRPGAPGYDDLPDLDIEQ